MTAGYDGAQQTQDLYTQPAAMTSPGHHARLFDRLPGDVAALAGVAQGVFIHEHLAPAYGVSLQRAHPPHRTAAGTAGGRG